MHTKSWDGSGQLYCEPHGFDLYTLSKFVYPVVVWGGGF